MEVSVAIKSIFKLILVMVAFCFLIWKDASTSGKFEFDALIAATMMVALGYVLITVFGFFTAAFGGVFSGFLVMLGVVLLSSLGLDKLIKSGIVNEMISSLLITGIGIALMLRDIVIVHQFITMRSYMSEEDTD